LARAIDKLEHDGALNEARTLRGLEEKVLANIPRGSRARIEVDEEALLQALGLARRPGPRPMVDGDVDDALAVALKGRRHIRMLYSSWGDAEPRWREVAPHGLLLGTRRYLVAHDVQRGDQVLRHYRVEGIRQVEILSRSFEPNPNFDLAAHAKAGFSSYVNVDEVEQVVWRFSPEAADRARRFVFHPDQSVTENNDGTITVSFSACGLHEMCWHLYSWGDKVDVIEPAGLRSMVADHRRSDFTAMP